MARPMRVRPPAQAMAVPWQALVAAPRPARWRAPAVREVQGKRAMPGEQARVRVVGPLKPEQADLLRRWHRPV